MSRKGENIHRRKDGRWEARILITVSGVKKYKSLYGKTYKEAKDKLLYYHARTAVTDKAPLDPAETRHTFAEVAAEWFETNKTRHKASTQLKYHNIFDNHIFPAFGNMDIEKIDEAAVNSFLADRLRYGSLLHHSAITDGSKAAPLSSSYVRVMGTMINSIITYAVRKDYRKALTAPIIKPTVCRKSLTVMNKSDLRKIDEIMKTDLSPTAVGIALAVNAGLRIGEVCALSWNDIDFEEKIIHVKHTVTRIKNEDMNFTVKRKMAKTRLTIDVPKTKSSVRDIPIHSKLLQILRKAKESAVSDYIVSDQESYLSPRTFEYRFHRLLRKYEVTDTHFHVLRHTFSTRCIEVDVDMKSLSEMLGHSNVSTTLNIYVHSSMELKRRQIEKLAG